MTAYIPPKSSKDFGDFWRSLVGLASGRSNATGTVTLAVSPATSTTVVDQNCSQNSVIDLMPTTANAAAALSTTYVPIATITNGSFIIQHASAATADRTFAYAIKG